MITFLAKHFIRNYQDTGNPKVREQYGQLSGIVGIVLNLCLFAGKLTAGLLSGAISILADAFNNLSDAGSSIITLIGFRLSSQKPDPEHPFGHGRIEYISGLIVSMLIILMGFELLKTSVGKILHPDEMVFHSVVVVILICSILVKLHMYLYNHQLQIKLDSVALGSTAADSLSDCCATAAVLFSTLFTHVTGFNIDGWCGLAVSLFIMKSGIGAAVNTINPLLGQPPKKEFVDEICRVVTSYDGILGVHDMVVHDYGPGRRMLSLHAEVPDTATISQAHDTIDNIELRLKREYGIDAVIHMDPISVNDPETNALREKVAALILGLGKGYSFHDFRIVKGRSHTNVIFDVLAPYKNAMTDDEIIAKLKDEIHQISPHYRCIINIDRKYI